MHHAVALISHALKPVFGFGRCLLLASTVLAIGCQPEQPPADGNAEPRSTVAATPQNTPTPPQTSGGRPTTTETEAEHTVSSHVRSPAGLPAEDLAVEVFTPSVLLSAGHQETCLVGVGDIFPDLPMTSLDGNPQHLDAMLGERLTIVVFWDSHQPMSVEQIQRFHREFGQRYRDAGVAVVTIHVGDRAEEVKSVLSGSPEGDANMLDTNGDAFAQVATGILPRTYLLRTDRQIVWFDMEYSRSSRHELRNAILYALRQFAQQANQGAPPLM